jgi:hypothetical protein
MTSKPQKVARVKLDPIQVESGIPITPSQGGILVDPFQIDPDISSVIQPAENFTVSINTISKELYSRYTEEYLAGRHNNDHFIILSRIGVGDQSKPTTKLNFMEHIKDMDRDYTDIWAENVAMVDDYDKDGGLQRIYISFHAFCQDLGGSSLENMKGAGDQIAELTGSVFPTLMPFTAVGKAIVAGVKNIFAKLSDHDGECKKVEFNLYPVAADHKQARGEAPLQEGSYIIFFEDTIMDNLHLDTDGVVRSLIGEPVAPYIVINVKKGKRLAAEKLDVSAAAGILSHYQKNHDYLLPGKAAGEKDGSKDGFLGALQEFGRAHRVIESMNRYYQLKAKSVRSTAEEVKFGEIAKMLKDHFNDQTWE